MTRVRAQRNYLIAGAILTWSGVLLQLYLAIQIAPERHQTTIEALVNFFSFFTILSNLFVALVFTFSLRWWFARRPTFFSSPVVNAGTAVYITIVAVTYSLMLRHLWAPRGWQKVADHLMHDVVPVVYLLYWLIFVPKRPLRWMNVIRWQIFPAIYLTYILTRGAFTGHYPYPFLDAARIGYPQTFLGAAVLFLAFLLAGFLAVAIGKGLARRPPDFAG